MLEATSPSSPFLPSLEAVLCSSRKGFEKNLRADNAFINHGIILSMATQGLRSHKLASVRQKHCTAAPGPWKLNSEQNESTALRRRNELEITLPWKRGSSLGWIQIINVVVSGEVL